VTAARPLRIVLDVNIFVTDVLSRRLGRRGTTSQKLVDAMLAGEIGGRPAQLVISLAMLESFRGALLRLGAPSAAVDAATSALLDLTRNGPDALDPYLLLDPAPRDRCPRQSGRPSIGRARTPSSADRASMLLRRSQTRM
jgi:hypothetical protein